MTKASANTLLLAVAIGLLVSACGQKGPLYLPGRSSTFESMIPERQPPAESESQDEDEESREDSGNTN